MKVFIDTNILIDVLGKRLPFYHDSAAIWTLAEKRKIDANISAVSFTNIFYIVRKLESREMAIKGLRQLQRIFSIAPCTEELIDAALQSEMKDFEDAVQLATAVQVQAQCLITRNPNHFSRASISILTPGEFLTRDEVDQMLLP